jgi:peptide/nickel transport system permease protein
VTSLLRIIGSRPRYVLSVGLLTLFLVVALMGPLLYPHGTPINGGLIYAGPSWAHPLGTDFAGRDILGEVVLGTRPVLEIATLAGALTMGVGTLIGIAAGYLGRWVDTLFMRVTDFVLALPTYPLLIILASILKVNGALPLAALLSLTAWAGAARAIRAQVLGVKNSLYIEAAQSLEMGRWHIAIREVFPSLMPYIVMHAITAITGAIYGEVGLYFLGVVPINADNWGVMLNWAFNVSGAIYSPQSVLFLTAPLFAITLFQMAAVFFNQVLEEYFNPNLRTA